MVYRDIQIYTHKHHGQVKKTNDKLKYKYWQFMSQKLISLIYKGLLKSEFNNRKIDIRYEQQDHRKRNK